MDCSNPKCAGTVYKDGLCMDCEHEQRFKAQEKRISEILEGLNPEEDKRKADAAFASLPRAGNLKKRSETKSRPPRKRSMKKPHQTRVPPNDASDKAVETGDSCVVPDCRFQAEEEGLCRGCRGSFTLWKHYRDRLQQCPINLTSAQVGVFRQRFQTEGGNTPGRTN